MEKLTKTQVRILEEFKEEQCREPWNEDLAQIWKLQDEYMLMGYPGLQASTGFERTQLRRALLDMKRRGIIELMPAVDMDEYRPKGSGYSLTAVGVAIVNRLFPYKPEAAGNI